MKNLPSKAIGTWSWGNGLARGDQVFGNDLSAGKKATTFKNKHLKMAAEIHFAR